MSRILSQISPLRTLALVCLLFAGWIFVNCSGARVSAVSASEWQAGRIIDDAVFFNRSAMDVSQIQAFLNAKVPVCDTQGTQIYSGSMTRAAYGASKGHPAPFTCLKNYIENPTTHANNYSSPGTPVAGGISAAQIIWNVAQQYNINPQVILVTLQKEQGLVTDDWPWQNQYIHATGANCPDTPSGCDPQYSGFQTQVDRGAFLFNYYRNHMGEFNFNVGSNYILWNVQSTGCGGGTVNIQSVSTAMLYIYTPYQPNAASVAAFPGQGDGCSSYGNRNFWYYFNNWFGSTTRTNAQVNLASSLTLNRTATAYAGDTITASYDVQNNGDYYLYAGDIGVCARINGQNFDFGLIALYLNPHQKKTISFSRTVNATGSLNVFTCAYNQSLGGWVQNFYPYVIDSSTRSATLDVVDNPLITTGIGLTPAGPAIGQPVTAGLTIQNNSNNVINIGSLVVSARDPLGLNADFPLVNDAIIPANGGTYTYSKSQVLSRPGAYSLFVANWNGVWKFDYPKAASGSVAKQIGATVLDNPLITSGITLSASPVVGQPVTATLVMRNVSASPVNVGSLVIAGRDPAGKNVDFPLVNDFIIPAGGTLSYSKTQTFTVAGSYKFFVANWNGVWKFDYPKSMDGTVNRTLTVPIN